jgi:8-oxo-dGTP pyrophosphatase MutT (NUDIX family)
VVAPRSLPFRPDRPAITELSAGAVVVEGGKGRFLLLHETAEDRWCFPKGHVEAGETLLAAARREIAEETGLNELEIVGELGEVAYRYYLPAEDQNVFKTTVYFLAITQGTRVHLEPIFDEARWETGGRALSLLRFETDRRMLAAAIDRWSHLRHS